MKNYEMEMEWHRFEYILVCFVSRGNRGELLMYTNQWGIIMQTKTFLYTVNLALRKHARAIYCNFSRLKNCNFSRLKKYYFFYEKFAIFFLFLLET